MDPCVVEVNRFRGGSVTVWGGIIHDGKTDLVIPRGNRTAQVYRDTVLAPVVIPFINRRHGHTVFQHDNARPQTAHLTTQFSTANNVDVIQWPPLSADLSPIEHNKDE